MKANVSSKHFLNNVYTELQTHTHSQRSDLTKRFDLVTKHHICYPMKSSSWDHTMACLLWDWFLSQTLPTVISLSTLDLTIHFSQACSVINVCSISVGCTEIAKLLFQECDVHLIKYCCWFNKSLLWMLHSIYTGTALLLLSGWGCHC